MSDQEQNSPRKQPGQPDGESRWMLLRLWKRMQVRFRNFRGSVSRPERHLTEDLRNAFGHLKKRSVVGFAVATLVAGYLATGVFIVNPGEQTVLRRLGTVVDVPFSEGIHYRLPWPIDQVDKVNVSEVRRADIGISLPGHVHEEGPPRNMELITGDENFVRVEAIVHYKISDPVQYLYGVNLGDERLVRTSIESALVAVVATVPVESVLTTEKIQIQNAVVARAQEFLNSAKAGLQLIAFNIQAIQPPDAVADSFRAVTTAKEERERQINQAKGYASGLLPEARGKANEIVTRAESMAIESVNMARGDAQKFGAMLAEYRRAGTSSNLETTKTRLFLETMERVLPRVKKIIVDPEDKEINLKLLDGGQ